MLLVPRTRTVARVPQVVAVLAVLVGVLLVQQVGHYAHESTPVGGEVAVAAADYEVAAAAGETDHSTPPAAPTGSTGDVAHWLAVAVAVSGLVLAMVWWFRRAAVATVVVSVRPPPRRRSRRPTVADVVALGGVLRV